MSLFQESVNKFWQDIEKAESVLKDFSREIDDKREELLKYLALFEKASSVLQEQQNGEKGQLETAMLQAKNNIHQTIAAWQRKIAEGAKGTEFMNRHEKYLVVMVFGAVKTGKSTLGNFLAGKNFLTAPFENKYKTSARPTFAVEESARQKGELVADGDGNQWFAEGVTDTTGSMQYFTLAGLRWFDSPGTGALQKDGDIRNMEEMVKEYLAYVDLCVFLDNSSEPGLRDELKYIERLSRDNQEALVVITKSDENKVSLVDRKPVKKRVAKNIDKRKAQEDDACNRIKEMYPEMDADKYRAISISTLVADRGIQEQDENLFRSSNLPLFMEILGSKASDEALALKKIKPQKVMNNFIRGVINGEPEHFSGITGLRESLAEVSRQVEEYKKQIEDITRRVTAAVCSKLRVEVQYKAKAWAKEVDTTGIATNQQEVNRTVFGCMSKIITEELNDNIGKIISNYEQKQVKNLPGDVTFGTISKQYKEVEHKYTEVIVEERDAEGLWENIRSFFGKTYFTSRNVSKVKKAKVDLGTDVDEFLDSMMPMVQGIATAAVKKELENVRDNYFLPQEEYVSEMKKHLDELEGKLLGLRYSEAV